MHITKYNGQFFAASTIVLAWTFFTLGCNNHSARPDEKAAVTSALSSNSLGDVSVSQDRDKGLMTLTGNVNSADLKAQAGTLAKQAAPDYAVANEIGVRPPGEETEAKSVDASLDNGIEDNFKAFLKANRHLNDQSIDFSAKNGTLVLTGTVKTARQKDEAGALAKKVPNVQQVVNEIKINPNKHSTAKS